MGCNRINKEIGLKEAKSIIKKISQNKIDTLKLMGGEPTLHSQLNDILTYSTKKFSSILIFTNGLFSPKTEDLLQKFYPKLSLVVNITTPAFIDKKSTHRLIAKTINKAAAQTEVTLSITIDPYTNFKQYLQKIDFKAMDKIKTIRIGLANPIAEEKNWYSFSDFNQIGNKLTYLVNRLKKLVNNKTKIVLNCGFTRCMFNDSQVQNINYHKVILPGYGCYGKPSSMDIAVDNTAFHCFSLYNKSRISLYHKNIRLVYKKIIKQRFDLWNKLMLKKCQGCPFYGHSIDKCPGPCLGFLINTKFEY